jgi:hypothetical protein
MSIKYIHLREKNHGIINGDDYSNFGGATIAYDVHTPSGSGAVASVSYFVAFCRDNEHYNKKIGAAVAKGRLLSPKYTSKHLVVEKGEKIIDAILQDYYDSMNDSVDTVIDKTYA